MPLEKIQTLSEQALSLKAGALAAAGTVAVQAGIAYWQLAVIGLMIGGLHWYHGRANADPAWTKHQSISEALVSALFGLFAMPASIDASTPFLEKHGVNMLSVKMFIGAVAAFAIVELIRIGLKYLGRKADG